MQAPNIQRTKTAMRIFILSALLLLFLPNLVAGQEVWFGGRAAGGLLGSREVPTKEASLFSALAGVDLERVGLTLRADLVRIRQSPDSDGRYYFDSFSNGGSACRDRRTGQFARDELCGSSTVSSFAPSGYVSFQLPDNSPWAIGFGARGGAASGPLVVFFKEIADGMFGGEVSTRGVLAVVSFKLNRDK